jgi:hypothetical protein
MMVVRAMQIRQRKLDTKAAAKLATAPADQKNKEHSSPPTNGSNLLQPVVLLR